ncbi:extensin [Salmonella enterica subsp. enterica serovar Enteritidis]|nr:extensin [Salmonella enterica subsp. enterica serovar Enteritidis]
MAKLRVGIVFGGKSAEHEVSLQSAKNIVDAIDKTRFDVVLLGIDKAGQWHVNDAENYLQNADDPAHIALRPSAISLAQVPGKHQHQLINAQNGQPLPTVDVIFPIVHGTLGEDGSLQGMLRVANLPFVGSDVLSSALFVEQQAKPLTETWMKRRLTRIEHLGSYACRNIYHRPDARRSEHASAEALDISGFQLSDGRKITVLRGWGRQETGPWLRAMLNASCHYYGNGLGPDYNAAHANHFHLGMRGYGVCR